MTKKKKYVTPLCKVVNFVNNAAIMLTGSDISGEDWKKEEDEDLGSGEEADTWYSSSVMN